MAKITPQFYGVIKKGQIIYEKPERRDFYLKNLKEGLQIIEILKPPRKPRSLKENAYYWGVVIQMISDETGFTPEEAHEAMKWLFLKKQIGKIVSVRSTATLNTLEFENYVENIKRFASLELNLYIPNPNEILNVFN